MITPTPPAAQSAKAAVHLRIGGAAEFAKEVESTRASAVLLDSYRQRQEIIASAAGRPVAMFDDHYTLPANLSLVINASPAAAGQRYENAPALLLGPAYASLDSSFRNARGHFVVREKIGKVLVALGGNDTEGHLSSITGALLACFDKASLAVCGAPEAKVPAHPRVVRQPWLDQQAMSRLMSDCDLAVFAGGQMLVQAACVGLPVIAWPQTANQLAHARSWQEIGSAIVIEAMSALPGVTAKLLPPEERLRMSQAGQRTVDGLGAGRIAEKLIELVHGTH